MGCKSSRKIYEVEENTLSSETKELLEKYENIQKRRHSDPIILKPIFKRRRRERERHLSV